MNIPQSVKDAYKEPHRKYHTTEHIESILEKIPMFVETYSMGADLIEALEIVAWYHDVVYEPGPQQPSNEQTSAWAFRKWMREIDFSLTDNPVDEFYQDLIYWTIQGTKTHNSPSSWLGAIFFDLDLADMGTDKYAENAYKIREEFSVFSDLEWLAGRIKFLTDFASRPFIFHTSLGYSLWEENARYNIASELVHLKHRGPGGA